MEPGCSARPVVRDGRSRPHQFFMTLPEPKFSQAQKAAEGCVAALGESTAPFVDGLDARQPFPTTGTR